MQNAIGQLNIRVLSKHKLLLQVEGSQISSRQGYFQASNVSLVSTEDMRVLAHIENFEARLSFLDLLGGEMKVKSLRLEGLKSDLIVRNGKIQGLESLLQDSENKSEPPIDIQELKLRRANLNLDIEGEYSIHAQDISLDLAHENFHTHSFEFLVPALELNSNNAYVWPKEVVNILGFRPSTLKTSLPIKLRGQGRMENKGDTQSLTLSEVSMTHAIGKATITGSLLQNDKNVTISELGLTTNLDLAKLEAWLLGPSEDNAGTLKRPLALGKLQTNHTIKLGTLDLPTRDAWTLKSILQEAEIDSALSLSDATLFGKAIGSLTGDTTIRKGVAHLKGLKVKHPDGTIAADLRIDLLTKGFPLRGSLSHNDVSFYTLLDTVTVEGSWVESRISGEHQIHGTLVPLRVDTDTTLRSKDFRVFDSDARRASVAHDKAILEIPAPVRFDGNLRLTLDALWASGKVEDEWSEVHLESTVNFEKSRGLELKAEVLKLDSETFQNHIGTLPIQTRVKGMIEAKGGYDELIIQGDGEFGPSRILNFELADSMQSKLTFSDKSLSFTQAEIVKGETHAYGSLNLVFDAQGIHFDRSDPTVRETLLTQKRDVWLNLGLSELKGKWADLRSIVASDESSEALIFFRDLELEGDMRGQVEVQGLLTSGIDDLLGKITFSGENNHILGEKLSTQQGELWLQRSHYALKHWQGSLSFLAQSETEPLNEGTTRHPNKTRSLSHGNILATLLIHRDSLDTSGTLKFTDVELSEMNLFRDTNNKPWAGATLSGELEASGQLNTLALRGETQLDDAMFLGEGVALEEAQVSLNYPSFELAFPVTSEEGGELNLTLMLSEPYPYQVELTAPRQDLLKLTKRKFGKDFRLFAKSAMQIQGEFLGELFKLGFVELKNTVLESEGIRIEHQENLYANVNEGMWQLNPTRFRFGENGNGGESELSGFYSNEGWALLANGSLDAAMVAPWFESIDEASGELRFELGQSMRAGRAIYGFGELEFLETVLIMNEGQDQLDLSGTRFKLTGENFQWEKGSVLINDNPVVVGGTIESEYLIPKNINLEVELDHFPYEYDEDIDMITSGQLNIAGLPPTTHVNGNLNMNRLRFQGDTDWEQLLPTLRQDATLQQIWNKDNEWVYLDIGVRGDNTFFVENANTMIRASADLQLKGTNERLGLVGSLDVDEGRTRFRNHEYEIERAHASFENPYSIVPRFDASLRTESRGYDITTMIDGSVESLDIGFRSSPNLNESEIVSLLTFGFLPLEGEDLVSTAGTAGLEIISAYSGLESELRNLVPTDADNRSLFEIAEFRITSQYSTARRSTLPALRLGLQLDDQIPFLGDTRLVLQSTLMASDQNGAQQRLDWEKTFNRRLRARTTWRSLDRGVCPNCQNQLGDFGADLFYRWDF